MGQETIVFHRDSLLQHRIVLLWHEVRKYCKKKYCDIMKINHGFIVVKA